MGERWARGKTRGEHRFMKLMKLRKNGEHPAVFYFAKRFFFYIYDVITSPGKEKRSTYHYLYICAYMYICMYVYEYT